MTKQTALKAPSLQINGKTFRVKKRLKLLRKMFDMQNSDLEMESIEGMEAMYQFVIDCFGDDSLTIEDLEYSMDIDEFFGFFGETVVYLKEAMKRKMDSMPKNVPGASQ